MTEVDARFLSGRILPREKESHKGDYGHLLLVCGCQSMPGAAVLSTGAALKSGCGLVTLHSTPRALQAAAIRYPSAILSEDPGHHVSCIPSCLDKYAAVAAGPGLGQAPETLAALSDLLSRARDAGIPVVLDADALNLVAAHPELFGLIPPDSVLTPHPGELRRLLPQASEDEREDAVRDLCRKTACIVLVKGFRTHIYTPEGECFVNTTGNPGMAKGGSGDVLTGLIGGLVARGYRTLDATLLGAWIHGYAGDCLTEECTAEAYDSGNLIESLYRGFKELSDYSCRRTASR